MTNHTAYLTTANHQAEVLPGNTITDFRGEDWVFVEVERGPLPGKSPRVKVRGDGRDRSFYSTVFPGLEVI